MIFTIFFRMLAGFLVQYMPFAVLCFFTFKNELRFSTKRHILITSIILFMSAAIFAASALFLLGVSEDNRFSYVNNVFIFLLLPNFLWFAYSVTAEFYKKLFIFSYALTSAYFTASISDFIAFNLSDCYFHALPYGGFTIIVLLISDILFLFPFIGILKKFYTPSLVYMKTGTGVLLSIVSIVFFILLGIFTTVDKSNFSDSLSIIFYIGFLGAIFLAYIVLFNLYILVNEKSFVQKEYMVAKNEAALLDVEYRNIMGNIETVKKMRHDLRHHLLVLQGMLSSQNYSKAGDYIGEYLSDIKELRLNTFSDNKVENIFLAHYASLADRHNIDFTYKTAIPSDLNVYDSDFSVVLGNILENAFEACKRIDGDGKYIKINNFVKNNFLIITVSNSCAENLKKDGDNFLSQKENHTGIGLSSIESIAKKYNGAAKFSNKGFEFHCHVMLQLNAV